MSNFQQDPSKSFGTNDFFRDKDNMRNAVNELRQNERQKRIVASQLRRNIKRSLRKEKDPSGFIDASKKLNIDPLTGGGLGEEAGRATRGFERDAAKMFEAAQKSEQERKGRITNPAGQVGFQAGAGNVAAQVNPFNDKFTPEPTSFAGNGFDNPVTELGKQASIASSEMGGDNLAFRQGLNKSIGMVKTPQELAELRRIAKDAGISDEAFDRQVQSFSQAKTKPDWAKDVEKDRTFKGVDLTRFSGMTREKARKAIMSEKVKGFMRDRTAEGDIIKADEQKAINAENQRIAQQRQQAIDAENARTQGLQDTFGTRNFDEASNVAKQRLTDAQSFVDSTRPIVDRMEKLTNNVDLSQERITPLQRKADFTIFGGFIERNSYDKFKRDATSSFAGAANKQYRIDTLLGRNAIQKATDYAKKQYSLGF